MPHVASLPTGLHDAAQTLWQFHRLDHELHPASIGIGLGSHDIGVATYTAELYHRGMFPLIVFSGANAPTTRDRFPRGEAVHYREHAITLGVPAESILTETQSRNTPENITFSRQLLHAQQIPVASVILLSRPYQQRRAYGIFKKLWPDIHVMCSAEQVPLDAYLIGIGDPKRVLDMLVGDTQRLQLDADNGWAVAQEIPTDVWAAYDVLVDAGYTSRMIPSTSAR